MQPCAACVQRAVLPPVIPLGEGTDEESARESRRARPPGGFVDAHVHLFPDGFYRALERWFDAHAWSIRFRGNAEAVLDDLRADGAGWLVALAYAHKPGVAPALNRFLGDLARADGRIVGMGAVMPGEPDARRIVRDAVEVHGLRGIKLHMHVQGVAIDDPRTDEILDECEALGVPAVVHAGRAPRTSGYPVDPHAVCSATRTRAALRKHPRLRLVVPHLGMDEAPAYLRLLDEHDNLWLDTSVACSEWLTADVDWEAVGRRSSRILYGTDFPILPYGVERERRVLARRLVDDDDWARVMGGTAAALFGLPIADAARP